MYFSKLQAEAIEEKERLSGAVPNAQVA